MICKNCGEEMFLDDVDFNFKGCFDNYFVCKSCNTSCIEKIRFDKSFQIIWYDDED